MGQFAVIYGALICILTFFYSLFAFEMCHVASVMTIAKSILHMSCFIRKHSFEINDI